MSDRIHLDKYHNIGPAKFNYDVASKRLIITYHNSVCEASPYNFIHIDNHSTFIVRNYVPSINCDETYFRS